MSSSLQVVDPALSQSEAQLLHSVLEDLQRHLHWQVQQLGPELLLDSDHLKAVRALALQARAGAAAGDAPARSPAAGGGGLGALRERLRQRATGDARHGSAPAKEPPARQSPEIPAAGVALMEPRGGVAPATHPGAPLEPGAAGTLSELRTALLGCQRCRLCESRTQVVFGTGNPNAELVFVGEAPGAEEDRQGTPFVGESGQLLTRMIEAMGYSRDEVYICNVIKCRPPNNRNPGPDELAQCEPFLRQQLSLLKPRAMVALGKFAAQALLRESTPISALRGIWREYEGIPLMPTYHPAYLLRQPNEKRKVWNDLQEVMRRLGKSPR